jgi:nitrite reductase/ring-hydroxylating ferredoxin subunit
VLIGDADSVPTSGAKAFKVHDTDTTLAVARTPNGFCAVANRCPHLGLPLAGGAVETGVITCPFHNSRFNLCTGENLDWATGIIGLNMPKWSRKLIALGKPPAPVKAYEIIEDDGKLYVVLD